MEAREQKLKLLDRVLKLKKRDTRLTDLMRDPEKDYAENWYMCVPRCFNDALDIRKTDRVMKGSKTLEWTQGSGFGFQAGNIIYDTKDAYGDWSQALNHINLCIQVVAATDAVPGEKGTNDKSGRSRNPGSVEFETFIPNKNRSGLVKVKKHAMTQDEFVIFLIAGPSTKNGELFG